MYTNAVREYPLKHSTSLSTYHTVDTEEECCDSEPERDACGFTRDILHFIIVYSTEYMMTNEAKHIHNLREGRKEGGGERVEGGKGGREGGREEGREGGRKGGREEGGERVEGGRKRFTAQVTAHRSLSLQVQHWTLCCHWIRTRFYSSIPLHCDAR